MKKYTTYLYMSLFMMLFACSNEPTTSASTTNTAIANSTKPKLSAEKVKMVNAYIEKLKAEEVRIQPKEFGLAKEDLSIFIKNSEVMRLNTKNEVSNVACADTLASLLWNAVQNKESYNAIKIGLTSKVGDTKRIKWIDYPTSSFQ